MDNPQPSGTNTPLTDVSSTSDKPPVGNIIADHRNALNTSNQPSESDSDLEPDNLLPAWLSAKSKLYESNPGLAVVRSTKGRRSNGKRFISLSDKDPLAPLQDKLLRRIRRIERDILFDQLEAERQWDDISKLLAQESAQRRKFGLDNTRRDAHTNHSNDFSRDGDATLQSDTDSGASNQEPQDTEEDNLLGELFQNLPESSTDAETGITSMTVQEQECHRLIIRDFGKWTGMSPRRILEDTCRARYGTTRKSMLPSPLTTLSETLHVK